MEARLNIDFQEKVLLQEDDDPPYDKYFVGRGGMLAIFVALDVAFSRAKLINSCIEYANLIFPLFVCQFEL